jgi:hypothetical protein
LRQAYDYWQNQPGNYSMPVRAIRALARHRTRTQATGVERHRGRAAQDSRGLRPQSPQAASTFPLLIPQHAVRGHKQPELQVAHGRPTRRAWPRGEAIQRRVRAVSSHRLVGMEAISHASAVPFRRHRWYSPVVDGEARYPERAIVPEGISHIPFPSWREFNLSVAMRLPRSG